MSVILFGSTGDLGSRVAKHLHHLGGSVICVVRKGSAERAKGLLQSHCKIIEADYESSQSLENACRGGSVVVSTVSGLEPVILDFQTRLIRAAVAAGVPRFIPSDFAVDYRQIPIGDNRNLNLLEQFRQSADGISGIEVTSILNGAFMDMLTGVAPFILYPINRILCWGDRNQKMDWTSIDDTALYTAYVALDKSTPRFLKIAGDELSAKDLAQTMTELTGKSYQILQPGGLTLFKGMIGMTKFLSPGAGKKYPSWQGMQYMHSMYSGKSKFDHLDNQRYPMQFTNTKTYLRDFLDGRIPKYELRG
jgi:uncharacterized protein YbjT (DUF2867 family)